MGYTYEYDLQSDGMLVEYKVQTIKGRMVYRSASIYFAWGMDCGHRQPSIDVRNIYSGDEILYQISNSSYSNLSIEGYRMMSIGLYVAADIADKWNSEG